MALTLGLPVNMNPCENIKSEIDEKIHNLEQQSVILRSKIAALRGEVMGFLGIPSPVHTLDAAIATVTTGDFNAGATVITQIQNFAGSCLDSIFNGIRKYAANLEAWNNDQLGNATSFLGLPEFNALQAFRDYKQALGASAVSQLLADIDEKLGCLAGQGSELSECLDLFDYFNDRVDDLLKYMGLSESGVLDLYSFAGQFGINIPEMSTIFDNINRMDEHLDTINTQIQGTIETVGESVTNAQGQVTSTVKEWF